MKKIILFFLISLSSYGAQPVSAIAQKPLDEFIVYEIPVAETIGNTTILFPSPISGIFVSKAAPSSQANSDFLIDYQPGSYYFTIRSTKPHVEDYINVIFEKKAYVFHVFSSNQPYRTLTLFYPSKSLSKGGKAVSPELLISLLDKVKSYSLLAAQHPEKVEGVLHEIPKKELDYSNYKIVVQDVYRFEESDTLIFRLSLENKTSQSITYNPQNVSIGLKENLYSTSIVDASGDIPPNSVVTAYFGITGTANGGRNNLSPKNDWNIILIPDGQQHLAPQPSQDDKKI
jgi:hypothetical protein